MAATPPGCGKEKGVRPCPTRSSLSPGRLTVCPPLSGSSVPPLPPTVPIKWLKVLGCQRQGCRGEVEGTRRQPPAGVPTPSQGQGGGAELSFTKCPHGVVGRGTPEILHAWRQSWGCREDCSSRACTGSLKTSLWSWPSHIWGKLRPRGKGVPFHSKTKDIPGYSEGRGRGLLRSQGPSRPRTIPCAATKWRCCSAPGSELDLPPHLHPGQDPGAHPEPDAPTGHCFGQEHSTHAAGTPTPTPATPAQEKSADELTRPRMGLTRGGSPFKGG